ncbi:hypothetical protein FOIG_15407 [Fusarium odoratissimum NRRL 54006]|uniref:Uncharacterized protein n=1 Tax=Fusarium odoratissimum (strain NRRL 54006) TaxID=1089451 RepID=X0K2U0_FUSO5|nr:uncharacterized protein FOIG_15407 [Fusarium odoratissimum NRRL 54006]EXL91369.1 hypothetical protein FOIG_15407 [Fusarium odoratissimum NRRL 54006]
MARKLPGHDHTGKAAHRLTESRRVYNASRNENDDPPDCLRIGSPAGKNRPSPRLGTCPVTSPVQVSLLPNVAAPGKEQCKQHDLSDAGSRSNAVKTIRNPPIPGDLAPSADALFARVHSFAKTRGFGVIKAHGMIRPGQRSRYVLQCDRYGAPRSGRGAGLRKRKSRKSGAYGRLLPRPCQRTVFSGLCGTSQMRNTTTTIITPVPMPPLTQFIDDLLDL